MTAENAAAPAQPSSAFPRPFVGYPTGRGGSWADFLATCAAEDAGETEGGQEGEES